MTALVRRRKWGRVGIQVHSVQMLIDRQTSLMSTSMLTIKAIKVRHGFLNLRFPHHTRSLHSWCRVLLMVVVVIKVSQTFVLRAVIDPGLLRVHFVACTYWGIASVLMHKWSICSCRWSLQLTSLGEAGRLGIFGLVLCYTTVR